MIIFISNYLLLIIGRINQALVFTYYLTFSNNHAFFWITNIGSFISGAVFPYIDYHLMKVFEIEIYI